LALSAGAGWLTASSARNFFRARIRAKLLRGVLAGGLGVIVFLAGTYIVLRVSGLTQLALTIVRTTVLMTLDGNLVQIPNAAVYKATVRNFTANPNRRESFVVGIGYDDMIDEAQAVALKVLVDHPAVLQEPEPWVLAQDLGKATVNLKIYFWLNGHEHSWLKVRPSVIRLVKRAFQQHGIRMPDEAREVIFPRGQRK
jgi:small conductance mechanosensitive channel